MISSVYIGSFVAKLLLTLSVNIDLTSFYRHIMLNLRLYDTTIYLKSQE